MLIDDVVIRVIVAVIRPFICALLKAEIDERLGDSRDKPLFVTNAPRQETFPESSVSHGLETEMTSVEEPNKRQEPMNH